MNNELKNNLQILQKHFDLLQKSYHVKKIGVFGSLRHGKQTRTSDIDILVELSQPMGFFKFIDLEDFLGKLLKRKVDLVTKNALKSAIKKDVLRETIYVLESV